MDQKYYLGLDIGTNSIGWAVTDEEYNLINYRHKDLWGIHLFEDAETAAERRTKRAARRRLERRKNRIDILQEIFAEEIMKTDETFFIRLNESRLYEEDKTTESIHPLFNDSDYTDINYYEEYPTIFHLRKELILNDKMHDVRLVYLALHHIIKNRGHFLIEGDINAAKNFRNTLDTVITSVSDELGIDIWVHPEDYDRFEDILKNKKHTKSEKAKGISRLINLDETEKTKESIKKEKTAIDNICKLIVGNKGDILKIFDNVEGIEKSTFSFGDKQYEESIRDEIEENMPDKFYVIETIKALHDWSILSDILDNEEYISFARVKQYEAHKDNLQKLRKMILKYCSKEVYNKFFNQADGAGYSSYVGSLKKNNKKYAVKKCEEDIFYKELEKLLSGIEVNEEDLAIYEELVGGAKNHTLLPLQRSKDNGCVPEQVHEVEMKKILENAEKYIPFLKTPDENGITGSEKIVSIFSFRVPYYVGPLSDRHKESGSNSWIVRKETGRIYPWNFDQKVDLEKSNEEFIARMTKKCTYLVGEEVLPKCSLEYSKYMVLNELNPLKIKGNPVPVSLKQDIFRELFMKHTKVTGKLLLTYLNQRDPGSDIKKEDISGFDENFKSSLSSYLDFEKKVFGERIAEYRIQQMVEDIIKWITIYGEDKKMLKKVIKNKYPDELSEEQIKEICKFRYSGWGSLSRRFLSETEGTDKNTGEVLTIMDGLWSTNKNLMQLLSDDFTFRRNIEEYNAEKVGEIKEISYDALVKDLYVSPANKRAIWRSIRIAEEIKKTMGHAPEKIFVEMARGEEKKKERKASRKARLLDLYKECKKDVRDWCSEIEEREERDFNSIKLYLYYTQMGRCMYTGEPIDIDDLMMKNSRWDRDHIYPQSKIKDDSLDNLVLVRKDVNAKKSNGMLSYETINARKAWWAELLECKLISKKKYDRLTRTQEFSEEELAGFISRQLVETRQSSKAVAEVLGRIYPESSIVYVKAGLVSKFRKDDIDILKSRRLNDYHHAKDAYLNIVVGNVYNAKFTSNPIKWMRENRNTNYSINRVFDFDVKDRKGEYVWKDVKRGKDNKLHGGTVETVKTVLKKNRMFYTEYTYCDKGKLFDETIAKKGKNNSISLKSNLSAEKYGGYVSPNTSYFIKVEFDGKKDERTSQIVGVPIYIANMLSHRPEALTQYLETVKNMKNVRILHDKIKKNSLLIVDGFPMRIRGENEQKVILKNNIQLNLDEKNAETVRRIEKYFEKNSEFEINEKLDNISEADMLSLYDCFLEKFKTIYSKRPANYYDKLVAMKDNFITLTLSEKAKVLNEILNMLRCDNTTTANLSIAGGVSNAGSITINKNTIGKSDVVLVNQSVTGIFENRVRL